MGKYFRTYLPFVANEVKTQLAYRGAFYLWAFISLFSSFISYFLWMAIYGSSESGVIGGLTQDEMVVYIFMVYVLFLVYNDPMQPLVDKFPSEIGGVQLLKNVN